MARARMALLIVALLHSADARADAYNGPPPWIDRALTLVAAISVPERLDVSADSKLIGERTGTGFFVDIEDQMARLVTARHVIWPDSGPKSREIVNLYVKMDVPGCRALLPATADSERTSPKDELDLALITLRFADVTNDGVSRCVDVIKHLPRHILDPKADSLPKSAHAWLLAPGISFEGKDARPIAQFVKYNNKNNRLIFENANFRPGDSGSPIFSAKGYILGMAIESRNMQATRFSMILTMLRRDWALEANLAGVSSMLSFDPEYENKSVSIAGAPDVRLEKQQPAPLGLVDLKLRISDRQLVTDQVYVEGPAMNCRVIVSRWIAEYREVGLYTTIGLAVVTGLAWAGAELFAHRFEDSPSRTSSNLVGVFNWLTVGAGVAATGSLIATTGGYLTSDTSRITCQRVP